MTDSTALAEGIGVLAIALAVGAWSGVMTARFSRGGAVMQSMAQRSFLPEKQRNYLLVLSIEGSMLITTGLVWGLRTAGWVPAWLGDALIGLFLGTGLVCVGIITWLGLRPSRLTTHEQAVLRNRALYSLVLAPMAAQQRDSL